VSTDVDNDNVASDRGKQLKRVADSFVHSFDGRSSSVARAE